MAAGLWALGMLCLAGPVSGLGGPTGTATDTVGVGATLFQWGLHRAPRGAPGATPALRWRGLRLRLRGGVALGWQHRVSKETYDIVNSSAYMQDWWANSTEECRPLIQKDSLVHIAKLWRERFTGADGELQPDAPSQAFCTPAAGQTPSDQAALEGYGLWVNSRQDRPCILLRAESVGIGGETLAQYCRRRTPGEGRVEWQYAMQEDWYKMGLYVDGTILAAVPAQVRMHTCTWTLHPACPP